VIKHCYELNKSFDLVVNDGSLFNTDVYIIICLISNQTYFNDFSFIMLL